MKDTEVTGSYHPTPCNKGKLIRQKHPLKLRQSWVLRPRLNMTGQTKELALFNPARPGCRRPISARRHGTGAAPGCQRHSGNKNRWQSCLRRSAGA